jgi:hypothetical protein
MADPNQNPLPDPKIIDQARDKYKGLRDVMQEALGIQKDSADILRESLRDLEKEIKSYDKINARLDALKLDTLNIKELEKEISVISQKKYINERKLDDLQKEKAKQGSAFNELTLRVSQAQINLDKQKLTGNATLIKLAEQNLKFRQDALDVEKLSIDEAEAAIRLNQTQLKFTEDLLKTEKKINKELGVSGDIMKIFANKLGLGNNILADMVEYAKKAEIEKRKISKWDTFIVGVKSAGKAIKENLNDPLVAFSLVNKANNMILGGLKSAFDFIANIAKKIFSLISGWNSQVFEFAKNLGIGETQSRAMMNHFQEMALTSGPLFLSVKGISEAFTSMTESLGFIAPMNNQMLETATLIQRQFGLTADHIQAINTISSLSGKSFKDTFDTITAISKIEGGRNKIMMTERQTMGEISKLSSRVLMNFKGNIPALVQAVVNAKKLGVELNDIQGTTSQFLDFESSISKEFEAQMFTGEDLNLQQLRRLALAHDTKGMMEEIGRRIPTLDKWNNMNTLAQEAYAEALGMSADKIAEIIQKQQIANRLGLDASLSSSEMYKALMDQYQSHEKVVEVMKAAGAQQYLNAAMSEKIDTFMQNVKNTLGQMLEGELGQTITKFLNLLNNAEKIKEIVGKIQGFVKGIVKFFGDLPNTIQKVIKGTAIFLGLLAAAQGAAGLIAIATGNPVLGAALITGGVKMGAAAYAANFAADEFKDLISVSDNAVRNQITPNVNISSQQPTTQTNQPVNVYMKPQFTVDGQPLHVQTFENGLSTAPVDNSGGQYFSIKSYSFPGQPSK